MPLVVFTFSNTINKTTTQRTCNVAFHHLYGVYDSSHSYQYCNQNNEICVHDDFLRRNTNTMWDDNR